jgi:FkbM family methyltransferase
MGLDVIKKYFYPTKVLDIGANVGQFYHECLKIFPESYYFLIDGNDKCEQALKNLKVDYKISMLSNINKEVDFYVRKYEPLCTGNSIYRENTTFFDDDQILIQKILTETLDDLFTNEKFDLIKIDVQGSELDIMKGGINLITKSKGVILEISLVEYNFNSPKKEEVYNFMESLGFYPVELIGNITHPIDHSLIQQDILFLKQN